MPQNAVLTKMLERLYFAILSGPALNCRPHSSRQRIDLSQLARFDTSPNTIITQLLGPDAKTKLVARATEPPVSWLEREDLDEQQRASVAAWREQQALLRKLKIIAEDAAAYQQDTGVNALSVGFPILSFPPRSDGDRMLKRVLAPVLFVPIQMEVRSGRGAGLTLACAEGGIDRVFPNPGLLVWIEKQTGHRIKELFEDENGEDPWREIGEILSAVCSAMELPVFSMSLVTALTSVPTADSDDLQRPGILPSGVLGLFPLSNQGLIRDTTELIEAPNVEGPLTSFVSVSEPLARNSAETSNEGEQGGIHDEFLVSAADPCQARAVRLARTARGLVVHGPPGTGKSQTITNVIGDHLARGQRVLFVCDKRTALDVVRFRLERIGLGDLCAVVHDPQRDQRGLYQAIRSQLDTLSEVAPPVEAERELKKINAELKQLHAELTSLDRAVSAKTDTGHSLHDLVGMWLDTSKEGISLDCDFQHLNVGDLAGFERVLGEIWSRAEATSYRTNAWVRGAGLTVEQFLQSPQTFWRTSLMRLSELAKKADELRDAEFIPYHEQFAASVNSRNTLADRLSTAIRVNGQDRVIAWLDIDPEELVGFAKKIEALGNQRDLLECNTAVPELDEIARQSTTIQLASDSGELAAYLQIAQSWYAILCFKQKSAASRILKRYGLTLGEANARKLSASIERERARRVLHDVLAHSPITSQITIPEEAHQLFELNKRLDSLFQLYVPPEEHERALVDQLRKWMTLEQLPKLADRLRRSALRAEHLEAFFIDFDKNPLFSDCFRQQLRKKAAALADVLPAVSDLLRDFATLENVLRVNLLISELPLELCTAVRKILLSAENPNQWLPTLVRVVLERQISRTLQSIPALHRVDSQYYVSSFQRYRDLKRAKETAVRKATRTRWLSRQQRRLLAATGSRLNAAGAELRRRLFLRGSKAMRLRQVVAAGANLDGGDPLFDVCPVWMASPETVAQVFPRLAIFDVLIFDEASQCRLEEALPVLTRAKRVVIAGDPKQLPPTRFFETAVATTDTPDVSDEQEWFEAQQGEIEDLLSASLNLEIEQSFLDVHYRSRNADLICFSNDNFYKGRLQPIPAHPAHRVKIPPLRLTHVGGVYEEQTNRKEAEQVVAIVRELLAAERPPSLGVACFNLPQKDLISELLASAAESDPEFAEQYQAALKRSGTATFEGLFVKNLENVQGDERDHIIISTTYGPDKKGKFRHNFGPLNRGGGGRRLNVLITRAREAVHLVTSIPRSEYLTIRAIPPGQNPNGAYLLFSYLAFAERLAQLYLGVQSSEVLVASDPIVTVHPTRTPSEQAPRFAEHLCRKLKYSSEVYWGNEGFCIDIAVRHPYKPEDVTVGVICDGTRYDKTDDVIEWDVFRTEVLESQGWQLIRSFSPALFRDFEYHLIKISELHDKILAKDLVAASQSGSVQ